MICKKIDVIKSEIPENVTLIAVSKTKPETDIMKAYRCNQRDFGENKVQELVSKHDSLPKDIRWHMIGHLQRNKVKYIAPFVHLIHGVDNLKLLKEIDKQALKNNRIIDVLLQIKIAKEETKFGMEVQTLQDLIKAYNEGLYPNVNLKGLMGMATFTDDKQQVSAEFGYLKQLFTQYKELVPSFQYLSMGMTGDYKIAIAQGSNMIRIGSAIFGAR